MEAQILNFDHTKLIKTFERWKQAAFFFDQYKKTKIPFEKYTYLSAAIVYTRSIYQVLKNELKKKGIDIESQGISKFFDSPNFNEVEAEATQEELARNDGCIMIHADKK